MTKLRVIIHSFFSPVHAYLFLILRRFSLLSLPSSCYLNLHSKNPKYLQMPFVFNALMISYLSIQSHLSSSFATTIHFSQPNSIAISSLKVFYSYFVFVVFDDNFRSSIYLIFSSYSFDIFLFLYSVMSPSIILHFLRSRPLSNSL